MKNIWSTNKYVNLTINILLFLLGMNFMHYAQIIIPVICLILFVDNKFKFEVNNIRIFIILCLFGISFLFFARAQGLFAFIGLFVPMAYYVGSNINEITEENVKSIIYIIAFGMMVHVLLNFGLDLYDKGFHIFYSTSHHDIWTLSDMSESSTSTNYVFFFSLIYYLLFHEKNNKIKYIAIALFVISSFYCIALGQRTILFLLVISFVFALILDNAVLKIHKINKKTTLTIISIIGFGVIALVILYVLNSRNYYNNILDMRLFGKLLNKGIKTERLDILIQTINNAPQHLWGNFEISQVIGIMPHDLWSDVYDIAGIITFILLVMHSVSFVLISIKMIKNKKISKEFKLFIYPLLLCISLQLLLEPIMSGLSVFFMIIIIIESIIEKLNIYAK